MKQYSRKEIERINGKEGVLLILHDKVFEVKSFLNEHPGGEEVLLDHAGKDASDDFDDVGHSMDAFEMMKKYQVGEIVASERTNKEAKKGWVAGYNSKTPENEKYVKQPGFPFMLFAAGLLAVLAIFYYLL